MIPLSSFDGKYQAAAHFIGLVLVVLAPVSTQLAYDSIPGSEIISCIKAAEVCPNENITFYLYTRETQDSPYQLDVSRPETISSARFTPGQPVKILIHGYTGHRDYSPNTEIRPAYLSRGYNVISVDYAPLVPSPCYVQATYNVFVVGNCTAQLLDALIDAGALALNKVHIVGFSLGGQVAGQIQRHLKNGTLTRVTGLDPALPLFTDPRLSYKLDSSDADFVDVIHTNAGRKGKMEASGHVDFYVNGGTNQPGCDDNTDGYYSCSHARAPAYFAESVTSDVGFWGVSCYHWALYIVGWCTDSTKNVDEIVIMGEKTPSSARGHYFVTTRDKSPFALGKTGATYYI